MPQHITVTDHDPRWPELFRQEQVRLAPVLGALAIYHIGSTAVPGLAAKPVIDMMAAVRSLEEVDAAAPQLERLGYEYLGEYGIPGRRYLRRGGDERTHQLHIFRWDDSPNLGRHLAVRDYLRAHPAWRDAYAAVKRPLARRYPYDIDGYCAGKDSFVRRLEQSALAWYDDGWDRLYLAARQVQRPRSIAPLIEAGSVAAALLTRAGNIHTGVCIDTACSLGLCAERSAIAAMVTAGEQHIARIVALMPDGSPGMPCGACRELMMQLDPTGSTEILAAYQPGRTLPLRALLPDWWFDPARQD